MPDFLDMTPLSLKHDFIPDDSTSQTHASILQFSLSVAIKKPVINRCDSATKKTDFVLWSGFSFPLSPSLKLGNKWRSEFQTWSIYCVKTIQREVKERMVPFSDFFALLCLLNGISFNPDLCWLHPRVWVLCVVPFHFVFLCYWKIADYITLKRLPF